MQYGITTALPTAGEVFAAEGTKLKILSAAELLIAQLGFGGTSIRAIAAAADVNIAAVNYHFGSKDQLFEAVFARRIVPMNRERLAQLDAAIAAHAGGKPTVAEVVDAFIRPPLALGDPRVSDGGLVQMQFISRVLSTSNENAFINVYYGEVRTRFVGVLHQILPQFPLTTMLWRYNLMVGALVYAMAGPDRMLRPLEGFDGLTPPEPYDVEATIRQVAAFCIAGLMADEAPPAFS